MMYNAYLMDAWLIPVRLIISFIIGAVIGLEREINEKKAMKPGQKPQTIIGLRSFSLITSLGTILGFLYKPYPELTLVFTAATLLLFIVFYSIDSFVSKDTGATTELTMIYSFIIGALLSLDIFPIQITLALTVVLILILSRKSKIKNVVEDIRRTELDAIIAFAIIALVILPFLPNNTYALADFPGLISFIKSIGLPINKIADLELFNPFRLWLIVALITGIDTVGYILERSIGQKKGWILASIAGGFVSSTATTQSLAQESKVSKRINHLLAAALLANLVSFIQIAILLAPVNAAFVAKLLPTLSALIISSLLLTFYFLKAKEGKQTTKIVNKESKTSERSVFEFGSALKFAGLYLLISIVSKIALQFFGGGAFLVTTAIGALIGLDAVMINTAQLAGGKVDFALALWAFIIANAVNLLGKSIYSYIQGKKEFAVKFAISMGIIIVSSLVGLIWI